eukprot:scaffold1364_cov22-Attheya_sp.AAC.1
MDTFQRKARYVAQGNMTEAPATLTYASVVSREFVPVLEKIWTICGPEFGPDEGRKAILVRAFYGLCSASAAFRNHMADCMDNLGFKSCLADQDL